MRGDIQIFGQHDLFTWITGQRNHGIDPEIKSSPWTSYSEGTPAKGYSADD